MRERSELILKIVCGVLAALLLFQLVRSVIRSNPLRSVRIPALPALPASLDAQTAATGTNAVTGQASGTNATNSVTNKEIGKKGTNSIAGQVSVKTETNSPPSPAGQLGTNSAPNQALKKTETNSISSQASEKTRTNSAPGLASEKQGTNTIPTRAPGRAGPQLFMSPSAMTKMPELAPIIQARIDRITQSEILAPFMRPMPMALLGIAGNDAFLRAPSGQTGLVKEGDELGGIKLLRIGINRVLVEQEGEKKELTIFSGLGSESLLPKPKQATNETITKLK
jgi:hypothetical protein